MKIYVVTQGEYSRYGIITATLDKSIAEAIAKNSTVNINKLKLCAKSQ